MHLCSAFFTFNLMSKELYFIGIIPNAQLLSELQNLKNYVSKKFGSQKVLRSSPHITLVPPFRIEDLSGVKASLDAICKKYFPLRIELRDFNHFSRGVVFVNVVDNNQLNDLYNDLRINLDKTLIQQMRGNFRPHITIGLPDMGLANFVKAKEEFETMKFKRSFEVNKIDIFKHDGKKWNLLDQE